MIFEKFYKLQERKQQMAPPHDSGAVQPSSAEKPTPRLHLIIGLAIAVLLCSAGYWFGLNTSREAETVQEKAPGVDPAGAVVKTEDARAEPEEEDEEVTGIAERLHAFKNPKNNIEKGQIATVFIQTSWGLGSGFFIDEDCRILTNKHVVQFDDEQLDELKHQIRMLQSAISADKAEIENFRNMAMDVDDAHYIERIEERIDAIRKNLALMEEQEEKLTTLLEKVQYGPDGTDLKVYLFDESEYSIENVTLSDKYDLALLEMGWEGCPRFTPSFTPLEIGQRVYTIGNPLGLSHTVTSGIVSGAREHNEIRYIQTDAPINQGNSGGPLIDEKGRIVGINTMILRDTEGIGFAFPIEAAMREFDLLDAMPQ
ncbi:MAG: trypsin-like serine protease [Desulfobacterales bacterium]|nr:trypsin-like serine protease [Desulfobacterales bacterium]